MHAADSRHRPRGAVDLPQSWVKKHPELHPALSSPSTRYPEALEKEWKSSDYQLKLLQAHIRLRQEEISKDEIRQDPKLKLLREECVKLHQQRIRINMDLIAFRKNYDSVKDPRIVTDVIPKEL